MGRAAVEIFLELSQRGDAAKPIHRVAR
jgi:hypothetical protein